MEATILSPEFSGPLVGPCSLAFGARWLGGVSKVVR